MLPKITTARTLIAGILLGGAAFPVAHNLLRQKHEQNPQQNASKPLLDRSGNSVPPAPELMLDLVTVEALDGTFSAKVPRDWTLESATWRSFSAKSSLEESVFNYTVQISGNEHTHSMQLLGARMMLDAGSITQKQYDAASRLVSPPLSPEGVLTVLMPKLNDDVSEITILERSDPQDPLLEGMGVGMKSKCFRYQYLDRKQGPMEGSALVSTTDPPGYGNFKIWTFTVFGVEAPKTVFEDQNRQHRYLAMMNSYQVRPEVIRQRIQEETNRDNEAARAIQQSNQRVLDAMNEMNRANQRAIDSMLRR